MFSNKHSVRVVVDTPIPNTGNYSSRQEIFEFPTMKERNEFVERLNVIFEEFRKRKADPFV